MAKILSLNSPNLGKTFRENLNISLKKDFLYSYLQLNKTQKQIEVKY